MATQTYTDTDTDTDADTDTDTDTDTQSQNKSNTKQANKKPTQTNFYLDTTFMAPISFEPVGCESK